MRLVLLAAVLLPLAFPAPAARAEDSSVAFQAHYFSDVPAAEAYYFDIMGTVGVIHGSAGMRGAAYPSEPVTRAEFAAMVLRLLELDPGFEAPAEPPPGLGAPGISFRDAALIPAWATRAVNACSTLGIISGQPDGRGGYYFKPNDNVNGAEAVAMLLRALDNADAITGGWPTGYFYRAFETGLLGSDLASGDWRLIQPLVPLTHAQMAYLLTNALFCSRGYQPGAPGGEGSFTQASIGGRLSGYALIVDVDLLMRTLYASDGRTLHLAGHVAAEGVGGSADLVGRRVFWLANSRGQIGYLRRYAREAAVTGDLDHLDYDAGAKRVRAVYLKDGRSIRCGPETVVELNGQRWPFGPGTVLPVASVSAIMEGGQAAYVSIIQEDLPEAVIIGLTFDGATQPGSGSASAPASVAAAAGPTTGRILARISMGQGDIPLDVTAETAVYLNGEKADLSDLREWDVFYAATAGSVPKRVLRLYAYRARVTGTVVGQTRVYDLTGFHWRVEIQDEDRPATSLGFSAFCEDQVSLLAQEHEYTFCLNREGNVTYFHTPGPAPSAMRVVKVLRLAQAAGRRFLTADWQGTALTFALSPAVAAPEPGTLVRLTLDDAGDASRIEGVAPALFEATVLSSDPGKRRVSLQRDERVWSLDFRFVPGYAVADINNQAKPGAAVRLEDLVASQTVWLEDPGSPGYFLVLGQ